MLRKKSSSARTYQEEVRLVDRGDTPVDDRPRLRVAVAVSILSIRGKEAFIDAFGANKDSQLGLVRALRIELAERLPDLWQFL